MISQEPAHSPDGLRLIEELEGQLAALYALEHRHGLSVRQLVEEQVPFFVIRHGGEAAGCVGLQFSDGFAEIKRMYVRPAFRGRGLAKRMLEHLEAFARERGIGVIRLETGIHQREAIALYESAGFRPIPPFGRYEANDVSRCYEKRL